ncbi:MAG: uridine kinase [Verrucomicrobiota bacterium]
MSTSSPVHLIAVVGGSGAGKSWLVDRLCHLIGERACRLQLDDFYHDRSHLPLEERARINFDVPESIDEAGFERVLRDCQAGRTTTIPNYDFATYTRTGERTHEPHSIVFVDGLWPLLTPALRALFDLKIFLDTPADLRRSRRLERDVSERGYDQETTTQRLLSNVLPMHERYVEPQKAHADIVLAQPFREADLLALADRLWPLVSNAGLMTPDRRDSFRTDLLSTLAHHEYSH